MAERKLSLRSQRRLRLEIARRLADESALTKRQRVEVDLDPLVQHESDIGDVEHTVSEVVSFHSAHDEEESGCSTYKGEALGSEVTSDNSHTDNLSVNVSDYDEAELSDGAKSSSLSDAESELCGQSELSESDDELSQSLESAPLNSLLPGSSVGCHEFDVALMSLCQRHNLTYACQDDIVKLMSTTYPSPNQVPHSSYLLRKMFVNFKEECSVTHFCGNCLSLLLPGATCSDSACSRSIEPDAVYIQLSLKKQLEKRLQG